MLKLACSLNYYNLDIMLLLLYFCNCIVELVRHLVISVCRVLFIVQLLYISECLQLYLIQKSCEMYIVLLFRQVFIYLYEYYISIFAGFIMFVKQVLFAELNINVQVSIFAILQPDSKYEIEMFCLCISLQTFFVLDFST